MSAKLGNLPRTMAETLSWMSSLSKKHGEEKAESILRFFSDFYQLSEKHGKGVAEAALSEMLPMFKQAIAEDNNSDYGFERWWHNVGSGISPKAGEELCLFGERVAFAAWLAARNIDSAVLKALKETNAYLERQGIEETAWIRTVNEDAIKKAEGGEEAAQ